MSDELDLQPLRDAFDTLADAWDDLLAAEFIGSRDIPRRSTALDEAEQHYAMLLSDAGATYADQRDELRLATVTGTMRFYARWQEGPPPEARIPEFMRTPMRVDSIWLKWIV